MNDNGFTLEEIQGFIADLMTARSAVLKGKTVRMSTGGNDRQVTREDLKAVTEEMLMWEGRARRLQSGGIRLRGVTFS